MRELRIKVEESELDFIINLLKKFDFIEINEEETLLEDEKKMVLSRYNELISGKVKAQTWENVKSLLD